MEENNNAPVVSSCSSSRPSSRKEVRMRIIAPRDPRCYCTAFRDSSSDTTDSPCFLLYRTPPQCNCSYAQTESLSFNETCQCDCPPCSNVIEPCCCDSEVTSRACVCNPPPICSCPPQPPCTCQAPQPCSYETCTCFADRGESSTLEMEKKAKMIKKERRTPTPRRDISPVMLRRDYSPAKRREITRYKQPFYPSTPNPGFPPLKLPDDCFCPRTRGNSSDPNARQWSSTKLYVDSRSRSISPINPIRLAPGTIFRDRSTSMLNVRSLEIATGTPLSTGSSRIGSRTERGVSGATTSTRTTYFRTPSASPPGVGGTSRSRVRSRKPGVGSRGSRGITRSTSKSKMSKRIKIGGSRMSGPRRSSSPPSVKKLPGGSFIMADVGPASPIKSQDKLLHDGQPTHKIKILPKCECVGRCHCRCRCVHRAVQCSSSCLAPRCACCFSCVPVVSCMHCGTCTFPLCCAACTDKEEPILCNCCRALLNQAPSPESVKQSASAASVRSKSSASGLRSAASSKPVSPARSTTGTRSPPERKPSSKCPSGKNSSRSISVKGSSGPSSKKPSEVCCRSCSVDKCVGVPSCAPLAPCHVCCCDGTRVHKAVSGHSIPECTVRFAPKTCCCTGGNRECSVHITKSNCCVRFGQLDCPCQTCRQCMVHKACSACFLHGDESFIVIPPCRRQDCSCQTDCRDLVVIQCQTRCCHRAVQTCSPPTLAFEVQSPAPCKCCRPKVCSADAACQECQGHGVVLNTPTHVVYGDHWCGNYVCPGDTLACVRHVVVSESKPCCCCCCKESMTEVTSICSAPKCEAPCAQQPHVQFDIPSDPSVCCADIERSSLCDVIKICNCPACVAKAQPCRPCTPVRHQSIEVVECSPCHSARSRGHCHIAYHCCTPQPRCSMAHPCCPADWGHCYNKHGHCSSGGVVCGKNSYTFIQPYDFTCHAGSCSSSHRWRRVRHRCGVDVVEDIGQCITCRSSHDPLSCSGLRRESAARRSCARSSKPRKASKSQRKERERGEPTSGNDSEGEALVAKHTLVRTRESLTLGKSHNAQVSDDDTKPRTGDDLASTPLPGGGRLDVIGSIFGDVPSSESSMMEHKADSAGNESANHPGKPEESCLCIAHEFIMDPKVNTTSCSSERKGGRRSVLREETRGDSANTLFVPQKPYVGETPGRDEERPASSVMNDLPESKSSYARLDSIGTSHEDLSKTSGEAESIVDIVQCAPLEDSEKCADGNADRICDEHKSKTADHFADSCSESAYAGDCSDETLTNTELTSRFRSSGSDSEHKGSEESMSHAVSLEARERCHFKAPLYPSPCGHPEADNITWSQKGKVCFGCGNFRTSALPMTSRDTEGRPEISVTPCNDVRTTHQTKICHSIPTSSSLLVGKKFNTVSSMSPAEIPVKKKSRQAAIQPNCQGFSSTKSVFNRKFLADGSHTSRSVIGFLQSKVQESRPGVLHPLSKDLRKSSRTSMTQNQTGPNPVKSSCRPLTQPIFIQSAKRRYSNLAPPPVSWRLVKTFQNAPSSVTAKGQEIKQQPSGKKPLGSIKSIGTHELDSSSSKFSLPPLHCKAGSRFLEPAPKTSGSSRNESSPGRPGSRYAIWVKNGRRRPRYPPKRGHFEWGLPTTSKKPTLASQLREKVLNHMIELIHQAAMQKLERSLGMRIFNNSLEEQQDQSALFGRTPMKVCAAAIKDPVLDLGHKPCVTANSISDSAVGCIPMQSSKMRPFRPNINPFATNVPSPQLHKVHSCGYDFKSCLEAQARKSNVSGMKWHRCGVSHFCESNPPSPVYESKHLDDRMYKEMTFSPLLNEPCRITQYGEAHPSTMRIWYPREEETKPNLKRSEAFPVGRPRTAGDYLRAHWTDLEESQPRPQTGGLSKSTLGSNKEADHQNQPNPTELPRSRTVLVQPFGHCPSPLRPPSSLRPQTGSSCGIMCNAIESLTSITPVDDANADLHFNNCVSPAFLWKHTPRNNNNNSDIIIINNDNSNNNNNADGYNGDEKSEGMGRSDKCSGHSRYSVHRISFTSESQNNCSTCPTTADTVDSSDHSTRPAHMNADGWDDESQLHAELQNIFETSGLQSCCRGSRGNDHSGEMHEHRASEDRDYDDLEMQGVWDISGNNNNNCDNSAGFSNGLYVRMTGRQLYPSGRRRRRGGPSMGSHSRWNASNRSGGTGQQSEDHARFTSDGHGNVNLNASTDYSDSSEEDACNQRHHVKREKKRHECMCPHREAGQHLPRCFYPHVHQACPAAHISHGHCHRDQGVSCRLPCLQNRCMDQASTSKACQCKGSSRYPWAREFEASLGNPLCVLPHRVSSHQGHLERHRAEMVCQPCQPCHQERKEGCVCLDKLPVCPPPKHRRCHCRSHETKKECQCHNKPQAYAAEPPPQQPTNVRRRFCTNCGVPLKNKVKRDEVTDTTGDICPCCCHSLKAAPIRSQGAENLSYARAPERAPRKTSVDAATKMSGQYLVQQQGYRRPSRDSDTVYGQVQPSGSAGYYPPMTTGSYTPDVRQGRQYQPVSREDVVSGRPVNLKGQSATPDTAPMRPVGSPQRRPSGGAYSAESVLKTPTEAVTPGRRSPKLKPDVYPSKSTPSMLSAAEEEQRPKQKKPSPTKYDKSQREEDALSLEAENIVQGVYSSVAESHPSLTSMSTIGSVKTYTNQPESVSSLPKKPSRQTDFPISGASSKQMKSPAQATPAASVSGPTTPAQAGTPYKTTPAAQPQVSATQIPVTPAASGRATPAGARSPRRASPPTQPAPPTASASGRALPARGETPVQGAPMIQPEVSQIQLQSPTATPSASASDMAIPLRSVSPSKEAPTVQPQVSTTTTQVWSPSSASTAASDLSAPQPVRKKRRRKSPPKIPPSVPPSIPPSVSPSAQYSTATSVKASSVDTRKRGSDVTSETTEDVDADIRSTQTVPLQQRTSPTSATASALPLPSQVGSGGKISQPQSSESSSEAAKKSNESSMSDDVKELLKMKERRESSKPTEKDDMHGEGPQASGSQTQQKPMEPEPEKKKKSFCARLLCCFKGDKSDSESELDKKMAEKRAADAAKSESKVADRDEEDHGDAESRGHNKERVRQSVQSAYSQDPKYRDQYKFSIQTQSTETTQTSSGAQDGKRRPKDLREEAISEQDESEFDSQIGSQVDSQMYSQLGSQMDSQTDSRSETRSESQIDFRNASDVDPKVRAQMRSGNNQTSLVSEQGSKRADHPFSIEVFFEKGDLFAEVDEDDLGEELLYKIETVDKQVVTSPKAHISSSELKSRGRLPMESRHKEDRAPVASYKKRRLTRLTQQAAVLEATRAASLGPGRCTPGPEATVLTDEVLAAFFRQSRSLPQPERSALGPDAARTGSEGLNDQTHISFEDSECEAVVSLVELESPIAAEDVDTSATWGAMLRCKKVREDAPQTTPEMGVLKSPPLQENALDIGTSTPTVVIEHDDKWTHTLPTRRSIRRHPRPGDVASAAPGAPGHSQQGRDSKPARSPLFPRLAPGITACRRSSSDMDSQKPSTYLHTFSPQRVPKGGSTCHRLPDPGISVERGNQCSLLPPDHPLADSSKVGAERGTEAPLLSRDRPSSCRPQPSACKALWEQIQKDLDRLDRPDPHQH